MVSPRTAPGLIVTRTPLRVSFAGGGTDLAAFYEHDYGAVLSAAIANYIYVTVKPHSPLFNESVRLNYSKSEEVSHIDEIENDIARECLKFMDIDPPIYISTVGDHPASTGLGGSSAFAVGLLNALHAYRGERVTSSQLAEEASHIEIDVLGEPIGKQDQYAAAFGGVNFFRFNPGGAVTVEAVRPSAGSLSTLFEHLLMFWTGHQRDAGVVLAEQQRNTESKLDSLTQMRDYACELQELMSNGGPVDPERVGEILHQGWQLKRGLASTITTDQIDAWYGRAMEAGASGGKLCGAGGGGCTLFVVPPERQDAVRAALSELIEVPVAYEVHGSRVLLPPGD
ncbi:MAG: GHMP kinase [Actinomycetota bacterium]|nr:GHMP kinase [Actinomycetota bacterium]